MNVLSQIYAVGCPPPPEQMNNPLHRLPVCRVNIVPHELNPQWRRAADAPVRCPLAPPGGVWWRPVRLQHPRTD